MLTFRRECSEDRITPCSMLSKSSKSSPRGQREARTAPALKPGVPSMYNRHPAVWTQAKQIPGHCPEFTFLRKRALSGTAIRKNFGSAFKFSFEEASAGDMDPSLRGRLETLEARPQSEQTIISCFSLLTKQQINCGDVWRIISAQESGKESGSQRQNPNSPTIQSQI